MTEDAEYEARVSRMTKAGQMTEYSFSCAWNRDDARKYGVPVTRFSLLPAFYAARAIDERVRVWADKRLEALVESPTPRQRWEWTNRFGSAHGEVMPLPQRAVWVISTWLLGLDLRVCLCLTLALFFARRWFPEIPAYVCVIPIATPFLFFLLRLLRYCLAVVSLFVIPPPADPRSGR